MTATPTGTATGCPVHHGYQPFEQDDPFPSYATMRAEEPVMYDERIGYWVVTRYDEIKAIFADNETLPECKACGGIVKTATISFGQAMPEREMARAEEAVAACDLCLVAGSSLQVYPAASFPLKAKRGGAKLAILNREATSQDPYADLVIHGEIGPILSSAVKGL